MPSGRMPSARKDVNLYGNFLLNSHYLSIHLDDGFVIQVCTLKKRGVFPIKIVMLFIVHHNNVVYIC